MKKVTGLMTDEAFKELQRNTVLIYLAEGHSETEKVEQLRKWRSEFCENPDNYVQDK